MTEVFFVSAARLPIGKFGGSLAQFGPTELGTFAAKAAIERAGVSAGDIDGMVIGNVLPNEPSDLYVSRKIGLGAGLADSTHAMNVNRLCGSGAQAVISAAQSIRDNDATMMIAGGAESMSNAPYSVDGLRRGAKMGDGTVRDWMLGALTCPFGTGHMGVTAENVAADKGITRERQDEFAAESQRRCIAARAAGVHKDEIVPVEIKGGTFEEDEHPRETTVEKLSALRPAFQKDGTVTAGNASGLNDGAAAMVLASGEEVEKRGLNTLGRLVSWGLGGVDPTRMGLGPVVAVPQALEKAGLSIEDIDLIESNEAFAAQALAVSDELGFDPEKTNVNGGAISHGHPIAATGAILTTKLLYALRANNKRYGLVTMCIGGGQGIALVIENTEAA